MYARIILALILLAPAARAQNAIEPIPAGDDVIVSLQHGEKAPWKGQLFSPDTALRWGNYLSQYRYHLELERTIAARRIELERDLSERQLKHERDLWIGELKKREVEIAELRSRPSPWLYGAAGAGGVLLVVAGLLLLR
jgi:hypothetical protein